MTNQGKLLKDLTCCIMLRAHFGWSKELNLLLKIVNYGNIFFLSQYSVQKISSLTNTYKYELFAPSRVDFTNLFIDKKKRGLCTSIEIDQ